MPRAATSRAPRPRGHRLTPRSASSVVDLKRPFTFNRSQSKVASPILQLERGQLCLRVSRSDGGARTTLAAHRRKKPKNARTRASAFWTAVAECSRVTALASAAARALVFVHPRPGQAATPQTASPQLGSPRQREGEAKTWRRDARPKEEVREIPSRMASLNLDASFFLKRIPSSSATPPNFCSALVRIQPTIEEFSVDGRGLKFNMQLLFGFGLNLT